MPAPSDDRDSLLLRIAEALERIAPPERADPEWRAHPAYVWDGSTARPVPTLEAPPLDQLKGIDRQKAAVCDNVARLAQGYAAHDMVLWGARGMGKSAVVKASVANAQADTAAAIALVQIATDALPTLPGLFAMLAKAERNFLIFIDDLGFAEEDSTGPRHLRSWLEGGVEARPGNVRLAVTSNRRAIVARNSAEQDDPINPRDVVDDKLALADRFGLSLGFHPCDQDDYLAIVRAYADPLNLLWEERDALEWAKRRGARSGRTAWQFVTEIAGKAGKTLR